jgi:hypothetical protein
MNPASASATDPAAIGPLALVEFPHPALLRKTRPVTRLDAGLREAVAGMFEIMYRSRAGGMVRFQPVSRRLGGASFLTICVMICEKSRAWYITARHTRNF